MNKELKNELIEMVQFHFQCSKDISNKITFKQLRLSQSTINKIEQILDDIEMNIILDIEDMEE